MSGSTTKSEQLAMSDACKQIIALDKAYRLILNVRYCPVTLWSDNWSAHVNAQKEGSNKLKDFDDDIQTIDQNLFYREINGVLPKMSDANGDYVK